jgi:hypothetical protein
MFVGRTNLRVNQSNFGTGIYMQLYIWLLFTSQMPKSPKLNEKMSSNKINWIGKVNLDLTNWLWEKKL